MSDERLILIADAHLMPSGDYPQNRWLQDFPRQELDANTRILFLGDMFNAWAERRGQTVGDHREVLTRVQELAVHCRGIYHLAGNRDFVIGPGKGNGAATRYAGFLKEPPEAPPSVLTEYGIEPLGDHYRFEQGGKMIHCLHGDTLCTRDRAYQFFLWFLRGPIGSFLVRYSPFSWLTSFFQTVQNKENLAHCHVPPAHHNIQNDAAAKLVAAGADVVICGHVHHEDRRELAAGGRKGELVIIPPWVAGGYYAELVGGEVTVKQIASQASEKASPVETD